MERAILQQRIDLTSQWDTPTVEQIGQGSHTSFATWRWRLDKISTSDNEGQKTKGANKSKMGNRKRAREESSDWDGNDISGKDDL